MLHSLDCEKMFSRDGFFKLTLLSGLRMLDQPFMTDLIEANAMGHMPNDIDIYSASWGPTDDGKTVDGPRNMTMRAIVKGVNEVLTTNCLNNILPFFYTP